MLNEHEVTRRFRGTVLLWAALAVCATGQAQWTWRQPLPQGNALKSTVWTGIRYVTVGAGGAALTSPDGTEWTPRSSGTSSALNAAVWNGNLIVAVGFDGAITTSPDGIAWTPRSSGTTNILWGVLWTGTQFAAAGNSGTVLTSPDGITWTPRISGTTAQLRSLAWTGTLLVVVGSSNTILTSPDGVTWTERVSGLTGPTAFFTTVIWTGSRIVAQAQGLLAQSTDGIAWAEKTPSMGVLPAGMNFGGVGSMAWTGSQAIAFVSGAAVSPGAILTSPDGLSWAYRDSIPGRYMHHLIAGGGGAGNPYVAVGDAGNIMTSLDGASWTHRAGGAATTLRSATRAGNKMIAVGHAGTVISMDTTTWTPSRQSIGNQALYSIASNGNLLVAVGNSGSIFTSHDGSVWSAALSGATTGTLNTVIWNGSMFLVAGSGGRILTSPDGTNWTAQASGTGKALQSAAWTGSQWVVVGTDSTILSSPDAVTWVSRGGSSTSSIYSSTDPAGPPLFSVVWTGTQLVAVGNTGTVLTSPDGNTWTAKGNIERTIKLNSLAWIGNRLVAVGYKLVSGEPSVLYTSWDAETWTSVPFGVGNEPLHVARIGGSLAVLGEGGIVLTSPIDSLSVPTGVTAPMGMSDLAFRIVRSNLVATLPPAWRGQPVSASVYALSGRALAKIHTERSAGALAMPVGHLPRGVYVLEIRNGGARTAQRFTLSY